MEPATLLGHTVTYILFRMYSHNYVYKRETSFTACSDYTLLILLKYFFDCSFCSNRPHQLYHNHESSLSSMPWNDFSQNLARLPLQILTTVLTLCFSLNEKRAQARLRKKTVLTLNNWRSTLSQGGVVPTQGMSGSNFFNTFFYSNYRLILCIVGISKLDHGRLLIHPRSTSYPLFVCSTLYSEFQM